MSAQKTQIKRNFSEIGLNDWESNDLEKAD